MRPIGPDGAHAQGYTRDIDFSPDGAILASVGDDGVIRLWSTADGRPLGPPLQPPGPPRSSNRVAFHPDGKTLCATPDRFLWLWDLAARRPIAGPLDCGDGVLALAYSPDGEVLITAAMSRLIQFRDGTTGRPLDRPTLPKDGVGRVAFSPDGRRIAFGSGFGNVSADQPERNTMAVFQDFATGRPLGPPLLSRVGIVHLRYSPDGSRLLAGDDDGTALLRDADGGPIGSLKGEGAVNSLAFSPDGRLALVGSNSGTARLMDARDGRQVGATIEVPGDLHVAFRPDGRTIVVAGDRAIRTLDVADVAVPPVVLHARVEAVAFGPGDTRITGGRDQTARIWGPGGRPVGPPLRHEETVVRVAVRGDGRMIATGAYDATVRL